jgi:trimethylamine:corrinoid methyltransferase-like protein
MKAVGHGNTFLTNPHAVRNFKKELYFRDKKKLEWQASMSNRMVPEAREIIRKLLKAHTVPKLDKDIVKQGDQLLKEYEKMTAA